MPQLDGTDEIRLVHGDGGRATARLIKEVFLPHLRDESLQLADDAAAFEFAGAAQMAVTTDTFVVSPLEFPGGDIGDLAVCGTVNDLSVNGARPRWLTAGFILEEGLEIARLSSVVNSLADRAAECGVSIVAADTKVVQRGNGGGIYINTTGVGQVLVEADLGYHRVRPGDAVVVTGYVGDHGLAVLSHREGLEFSTPVVSDTAPVWPAAGRLLKEFGGRVRFMRDPTRGGLASILAEIADSASVDLLVEEEKIPVRHEVQGAADMLGLDPLYMACEGQMVLVICSEAAGEAVEALSELTSAPAVIGQVQAGTGLLKMRTPLGGTKRLGLLSGDPLPRIC